MLPEFWSEQETTPLETKKWKEGHLSRPTQRPTHPNPNTFPLCGPVRWSLKCCHDGSALSAQCRPTDALPGGQARGEQGSGPGASSALPRIQIGQCVVGEEGHREGHTHTYTLTMNKKGSCQLNSSIGHDGKGHLVSMWGSQASL